jgi:hypothetical protein
LRPKGPQDSLPSLERRGFEKVLGMNLGNAVTLRNIAVAQSKGRGFEPPRPIHMLSLVCRGTRIAAGRAELPTGQLTWPHSQSQAQDCQDDLRHRIW